METHPQLMPYLVEILGQCKATHQFEKVLSLIVDRLVRMHRCQTCAVVLIDPKTEYLAIDNQIGLSQTFCNAFRRTIATTAVGQLLWTGKPIVIGDAAESPALAAEVALERAFGSCACLQISVAQRPLGYLHLDSARAGAFSDADLPQLQVFADLAGLAVARGRLVEENLRLERLDRETGLDKYVPWLEKLRVAAERAASFQESYSVLLLDVDNFKQIVNTYGFEASRELLREMGEMVRAASRPVDAAGRYGFDEFVLLLVNTDLEHAVDLAQKLRGDIEERVFTSRKFRSTVSIGAAAYPQNGATSDDLLTTAKRALFEAQRGGRNSVRWYPREWYVGAGL